MDHIKDLLLCCAITNRGVLRINQTKELDKTMFVVWVGILGFLAYGLVLVPELKDQLSWFSN